MKSFILSLVCLLCVPLYLQAQSLNYPTGISYQGKLLNNGQLYEGTESILFELISENNIIRWSETQQVTITRGLYSVILGSVVPFGDDLFTENNDLMLRIKIGDNPPMMVSALNIVPYAYMAKSVADGAITTESIEGEGSNKVLVTNEQGNVTWVNQSELQTTAASLGSAGGDVSGNYNNLQINSNVITTNEIQDGTIVTEDIADNSVTVEKLSDDVVETIKIKNNAVIASKISTGAVETDKIQDNAITTDKIVDGAITESKIQGGGNNKVMTTTGTGDVIWVDRSTFTSGSLGNAGGDLSGDYSALEINAGVITETEIADNAVTEDKIQNSSVTTSKIQSTGNDLVLTTDATGNVMWENRNSFTTGSLGSAGGDVNGNYSNLQINPNAITETEIANSSVTTSKIQSTGNDLVLTTDATGNVMWENRNSFTAGSLGSAGGDLNGNYSNLQINPNAVTETELANSSVTTDKIQSTGNDLVLTTDATGNVVWENRSTFASGSLGSAGGDLNGNYSNLQINPNAVTETELANSSVTTSKIQSTGNDLVLTTDATGNVVWENRSSFDNSSLGSAGGDLNGNYSNLQINPNAVTETELANSSVTTSKIQSTGNDLVLTTDGSGNVMWENRNSFTAGSLGSAGGDLNGNYSNLQINPNAVTETELANSSVTTSKIQSTGNDLVLTTNATGNVVWENRSTFASGSLGSAGGDVNGNYSNLQINPNAVTETELANSSVTTSKIQSTGNDLVLTTDATGNVVWENRSTFASGSLGSAGGDLNGNYSNLQINPNAVTETELANSSVTTSKIQSTGNDLVLTTDATGNVMWENRNSFTTGSLGSAGGDLNGNYSNLQINPNAVTETELANSSVTTSKIQSTGNDLVLTTDATGNVVWENRNSFTAGSLGSAGGDLNGNYSNLQINPNAVTETEIANNAVTANKIQNGAVTDAKISSLDPSKLQQDGASNGQVLKWDGSSWSPANDNNFGGSGAISYYSIDPFDFKAGLSEGGDESKNNVIVFENYTQAVTIHKDNEGETISAAFHLPHGATVQSITVYYLDDRGGNIDFYVDRKAFGTATTVISSATSNENDNSVSTKVLGTSFVIDNQNYSYAFRAVFDVGGGDVDDVSDIEHAIYGVKIQYMIP